MCDCLVHRKIKCDCVIMTQQILIVFALWTTKPNMCFYGRPSSTMFAVWIIDHHTNASIAL